MSLCTDLKMKTDSEKYKQKSLCKRRKSSSCSESDKRKKHNRADSVDSKKIKKHKVKKKRRKSSSSSSDSEAERKRKALKKQKHKKKKKRKNKSKDEQEKHENVPTKSTNSEKDEAVSDVPLHLMEKSKLMAPMTKEEWEKRQSVIRKVYDEETGRYRLIKGDGEILEEIVSWTRHQEINKQATQGDGTHFQSQLANKVKSQLK